MRTNPVLFYSLLATLLPSVAMGGIRVGNMSRSNAQGYQQLNEMRNNSVTANTVAEPTPVEIPIAVSNSDMENSIRAGDANAANNMAKLENCSMIYPDGEFAWTRPTMGRGAGGAATCTAVIEMRAIGAGANGGDAVLARANLAAGDTIKCNISDFPDSTYLPAAGEIEFPADTEPTVDDVKKIMNAEQKQNAGLKIAAGALIGGLGGNMAGDAEPGHDGLLGGGRSKTNSTIIGALGGAALMAGNAYTGKVAGDTILSTGVNAAAGAVVGNIVASGDSVLQIEQCTVDGNDQMCLWGYYEQIGTLGDDDSAYVSITDINNFRLCKKDGTCTYQDLNISNATIDGCVFSGQKNRSTGNMDLETFFTQNGGNFNCADDKFCYQNGKMQRVSNTDGCDIVWARLNDAKPVTSRVPAMVVGIKDKPMGWKKSNWQDFVSQFGQNDIIGRTGNGVASNLNCGESSCTLENSNFTPLYRESEDGGIIDMSNKARLKGTLTGAGVGGGMGAFAGYQGAQKEVDDRWVTAVREYKDSLQKVYCVTGTRFLSYYNDVIIIPNPEN